MIISIPATSKSVPAMRLTTRPPGRTRSAKTNSASPPTHSRFITPATKSKAITVGQAAEEKGRRPVDPRPEGQRRGHELGLQAVHVGELVLERAAQVLVDLGERHMRVTAHLRWHHDEISSEDTTGERAGAPSPARVRGRRPLRPRGA